MYLLGFIFISHLTEQMSDAYARHGKGALTSSNILQTSAFWRKESVTECITATGFRHRMSMHCPLWLSVIMPAASPKTRRRRIAMVFQPVPRLEEGLLQWYSSSAWFINQQGNELTLNLEGLRECLLK